MLPFPEAYPGALLDVIAATYERLSWELGQLGCESVGG